MINSTRLADEFARQSAISSPARSEGAMAVYLAERLRQLNAEVIFDTAATTIGSECGNLIARLPARRKSGAALLLAVHLDTVGPAAGIQPVLRNGIFTSAGKTVLGADDKAGIAEIIEALEVLRENDIPHVALEIVATVCEEIGLVGAKHLDYTLLTARRALALDTNGVDRIISRAPAANKLHFEIIGREAHAGIAPEKGLSAICVAARGIDRMPLGRIDEETTANIGLIAGGDAGNIIPRSIVLEGEARSHDRLKLARQTDLMRKCLEDAADELAVTIDGERLRAMIHHTISGDYPAMNVAADADIVNLVRNAATALHRPLHVLAAGGGSDANIFNEHGIETVIMGTGMDKVHTIEEQVTVADMVRVTELLVEVIRQA
ncbi:MAG: M20/M25/M40 family metallo-hydrolase [Desulfuromonadales bacterium]|nr:M20/M25/M40 family metallo-hydrolase [Desulfuromonadales bacterium]